MHTLIFAILALVAAVAAGNTLKVRRRAKRLDALRRARRYLRYARELDRTGQRDPARIVRWAVKRGLARKPRRLK